MIFIHIASLPSRKLIIFLPPVQRAHFSVGSVFKIYWTELDFVGPLLDPLFLSKIASNRFAGSVTRTIPEIIEIFFIRERR